MLPVYNEVNRIQVGNPVPIGSSESERAFSEAEDALGKAIFDLGNALDKKEKEDKNISERQQILNLLKEGKITAEEAERLLKALK